MRTRTLAVAATALLIACATADTAASASTSAPDPEAAVSSIPRQTDPVYPTFAHVPADQAAHTGYQDEWWYTIGHVQAGAHRFGYEVTISSGTNPQAAISITDQTTGQYYSQTTSYPSNEGSFSTTKLDVRVPSASLSGPMNAMRLTATLPEGTLDLTLDAKGPVLYNGGTGLVPLLGGYTYYYSLPTLATSGTLVENGHAYPVTGESWLDRQWGDWNWNQLTKWTWMGVELSNGMSINLTDLFETAGPAETHSATVLYPDGTLAEANLEPLALGAAGIWTSPNGNHYATNWTVRIPTLGIVLKVAASPADQQFTNGPFEGDSTVAGTIHGLPITGQAYAEQFGNWS
jgi:predicted secreted hydrolase